MARPGASTPSVGGMDEVSALLTSHTDRLLGTVGSLPDVGGPSLCEGWTRGHVITHVARNAEALTVPVEAVMPHVGIGVRLARPVGRSPIRYQIGTDRKTIATNHSVTATTASRIASGKATRT